MTERRVLNHKTWAILIFGMAFVVRLIYLLQTKSSPYFLAPMVDELWHLNWAKEILEKSFWGTAVYFRGPLYPYLLAFLLKITGSDYFWTRLAQMIIGSASVSLLYLLGREFFSEKIARLASLANVLYGTIIFYEGLFLIEVLFVFLNIFGLWLFARGRDYPRRKTYLLAGLAFGLSAIARPNILLVLPFLALWLFLYQYAKIGTKAVIILLVVFSAGVALPILPVTIRNFVVADDLVLISSQGGINLYLGNNPSAEGLTMIMPEIVLDARVPVSKFVATVTAYEEKTVCHPLKPSEESSFWANRAKQFMFEHPGQFFGLTFRKLVYFFSGFENSDQYDIYDYRQYSPLLSVLIFDRGLKFPFGLLAPLALVGIALSYRRWRELAPLLIFVAAYIPTVILFLVTARHRLTVIPILLLFASYAVFYFWDAARKGGLKRLAFPATGAILLLVLSNINFFDLGFHNVAQTHYNLGLTYARQGKYPEAITEYQRSLEKAPSVPAVLFALGTAYNDMGKFSEAIPYLNQAVMLDPNYTDALVNLGIAYSETNQLDRAEMIFLKVVKLEPNRVEPYFNLGRIYLSQNQFDLARQNFLKTLDLQPDNHAMYARLGVVYGRAHDTASAYVYFARALELNPSYCPAYLNWGNICLANGDTAVALEKYDAAIRCDSTAIEPHYNLAILYARMGNRRLAREQVDAVLRIKPDFSQALELKRQLGG